MKGIIGVIKRLFCLAFSRHEWDERTLIRWCVKCLWLQIKDPKEGLDLLRLRQLRRRLDDTAG